MAPIHLTPTPDSIADTLNAAVKDQLLDKATYYAVQRDCVRASQHASPLGRLVLRECSRLAEEMAKELEDGAIDANYLLLWKRYADQLEIAVRLANSPLRCEEVVSRLAKCVEIISPPNSGLN